MRRPPLLKRLDLSRDLWASSSSTSPNAPDDADRDEDAGPPSGTFSLQQPVLQHRGPNRRALLPAYPPSNRNDRHNQEEHLLHPHIPRHLLTQEQRQQRKHNAFPQSFALVDQRRSSIPTIPSFFMSKYEQFFADLSRRLNVDVAILDYNYERLFKCLDIMRNERIQRHFQSPSMSAAEQLPIEEYPIALEFYLQIDVNLFYMKTCSFRGARPYSTKLFSYHEPDALYGQLRCNKPYCNFCFPTSTMNKRAHYYPRPVLEFSPTHRHQFVNGFETILNCPVQCQTKHIIYALTCPCKQVDYIGYTSMSLGSRLAYHRAHGNRIIHEFILGPENIRRAQYKSKSQETLVKDGMLLYQHSARCPHAMQMFLDCNPQYWPFIPMPLREAQDENQSHQQSPAYSSPRDPTSHVVTSSRLRSEHDAGCCMVALPPFPSDQYTFSQRQCMEQFEFFTNKQDLRMPNLNLDLYDASIIAVLPDRCSNTLQHLVEALLITHAETKLNKLGHLDGSVSFATDNADNNMARGHWCHGLVRRSVPSPSSSPTLHRID